LVELVLTSDETHNDDFGRWKCVVDRREDFTGGRLIDKLEETVCNVKNLRGRSIEMKLA
jgi:hypothetical protein